MSAKDIPLCLVLVAVVFSSSSCLGHAREKLALGCAQENGNDCLTLGFMLLKGQDGRKNPQEALKYFVRSCELGNSIGCKKAGDLWDSGVNGFDNPRKAQMYYRMAKELEAREISVGTGSQ
jgi:TPR repeat protein